LFVTLPPVNPGYISLGAVSACLAWLAVPLQENYPKTTLDRFVELR
jgi:hypothetical protein